jgi:hypothetical protein
LRRENASLRQATQSSAFDTAALPNSSSTENVEESERLRKEHAELLRLRGEVSSLRRRIGELTAMPAAGANRAAGSDDTVQAPVVVTNTVRAQTSLAPGEAFVTGGWPGLNEKRIFAFIAPEFAEDGSVQITTRLAEVPESALNALELAQLKSESGESSARHILSAEQHSRLMNLLQETEGVDILSTPRVATASGRQAQVQMVDMFSFGGQVYPIGPVIDLVPEVSADRRTIDLTVSAQFLRKANPAEGN